MCGAKIPGRSPTLLRLSAHLFIQSESKEVQIYFLSFCHRYFPLLAKQRPGHPQCGVLLNVFALLFAKKASPLTIAMVMDIAETLATTEDFVASESETELSVNGCVFPQPEEGALITAG